ncbi:sulfotransferase, partial [bacterium]|nr:sulfotransferase [bacterium]
MQSDNVVLVCGLARSGTTWVAKMLDSHPDTRYVHEPDDLIEFRQYLKHAATTGRAANIRELVAALNSPKRINQSGSWPVCRKRHEGELGYRARQVNALALRLASRRLGNLRMRSLTSANDYALSTVWKSVNQLHALPGLMDTWPEMKVMLLLRHPAAVIASRKRGVALGKMAPL